MKPMKQRMRKQRKEVNEMALKRRFDFTKKNKRTKKMEKVGYLDFAGDDEKNKCSL